MARELDSGWWLGWQGDGERVRVKGEQEMEEGVQGEGESRIGLLQSE